MDDEVDVHVWEDREVKFDILNVQNTLRNGEQILHIMDYIEDTKGNPTDGGRLFVTNLRIVWYSLTHTKFNLSIGLQCVISMTTKTVLSKLRGTTQALYILTTSNAQTRFEFIFTNMALDNTRQFASVFQIHRLYQSSVLYRELKLRSSIVGGHQLKVLPQEQVYRTVSGIWNLSSDQGNLGTFVITNVRLVWFADINELFNISLPYMQMASIRVRESKYGKALVINTLATAGGYVLGFRVDPIERLKEVFKELTSLFSIYRDTPIFGVFLEHKGDTEIVEDLNLLAVDDIEEVESSRTTEMSTKFSNYLADNSGGTKIREPNYCKELGFSMERIKDGYTLSDLWDVIPAN